MEEEMEDSLEEESDVDVDKTQQSSIREELSKMSFEELQKLKEKLGSKVYNEAMFGTKKAKQRKFKRENKNRPREVSSKRAVSTLREVVPVKKAAPRDPRFDSLCGTFSKKSFKTSYSFINEIKAKEKEQLKRELKKQRDPSKQKKIQYLIQRMENQEREEKLQKTKEVKKQEEHNERIAMLREGKKPHFPKPSERRLLSLVDRYEELKKSGKLQKHIEKQRKKSKHKDRKKLGEL